MGEERRIRILRVLEYVGPESWVRNTLAKNAVKGVYHIGNDRWISEAILGDVSEILPAFPPMLPETDFPEISLDDFESHHCPIHLIEASL